ncbi:uncharacterized protein LOC100410483 [Callithrix jacchus]
MLPAPARALTAPTARREGHASPSHRFRTAGGGSPASRGVARGAAFRERGVFTEPRPRHPPVGSLVPASVWGCRNRVSCFLRIHQNGRCRAKADPLQVHLPDTPQEQLMLLYREHQRQQLNPGLRGKPHSLLKHRKAKEAPPMEKPEVKKHLWDIIILP